MTDACDSKVGQPAGDTPADALPGRGEGFRAGSFGAFTPIDSFRGTLPLVGGARQSRQAPGATPRQANRRPAGLSRRRARRAVAGPPDAIFVLGPEQPANHLVWTTLAAHPDLIGVPPLHLATSQVVGDWLQASEQAGRWSRDGLIELLAQQMGHNDPAAVFQYLTANAHMPTATLWGHIAQSLLPKVPVEIVASAADMDQALARLARFSRNPLFVHVAQHPWTACEALFRGDPTLTSVPGASDPQSYWLSCHDRIDRFLAARPAGQVVQLRGEDVDANPEVALAELFERFSGAGAAQYAPPAAARVLPDEGPLTGWVPWRGDGGTVLEEVAQLAQRFGYSDGTDPRPAALPKGFDGNCGPLVAIEPMSDEVPMPHANLLDNSTCALPPLETVTATHYKPWPRIGLANFGCYTAGGLIIAVYDSPEEPALIAYDAETGAERWRTPLDYLPAIGTERWRLVSGVLMAALRFEDGTRTPCIFVGNRAELMCLDMEGRPIWAVPSTKTGPPRNFCWTPDLNLIFASRAGNLSKIAPLTGEIVDICDLTSAVTLDGVQVPGRYHSYQSFVVEGDYAYIETMFTPTASTAPDVDARMPADILRFRISGTPEGKIVPPDHIDAGASIGRIGCVGNRLQGGSPSAMCDKDGRLILLANGYPEGAAPGPEGRILSYQIRAFGDAGTGLEPLWTSVISRPFEPRIVAAPALDPVSATYLAASKPELYIYGGVDTRRGADQQPDMVISAADVLSPRFREGLVRMELSSPITLARHDGETGFVAYIAGGAWYADNGPCYSLMSAIAIDPTAWRAKVLWTMSLAQDDAGQPIPGTKSYAQPALFRYGPDFAPRVGVAMSTMSSGIMLLR